MFQLTDAAMDFVLFNKLYCFISTILLHSFLLQIAIVLEWVD